LLHHLFALVSSAAGVPATAREDLSVAKALVAAAPEILSTGMGA
jgi:hypothetical protein